MDHTNRRTCNWNARTQVRAVEKNQAINKGINVYYWHKVKHINVYYWHKVKHIFIIS